MDSVHGYGRGALGDAFAGGVGPWGFAGGVAGADADPDFFAGGQVLDVEGGAEAGGGGCPGGGGEVGVGLGVFDFEEVDEAGLAVAVAGEFAVFVAGGELEVLGDAGGGALGGFVFEAGTDVEDDVFAGGVFAEVVGEGGEVFFDVFVSFVAEDGLGFDGVFGVAEVGFFLLKEGELAKEGGEEGAHGGKVGFHPGLGADGADFGDEGGDGEVFGIQYDV